MASPRSRSPRSARRGSGAPTLIAGVPTLYEALIRHPALQDADLSSLRAAFSGADSLPEPVRLGCEKLVAERGGRVRLLEGYGLTETVTGIMGMPLAESRPGSIGVPLPDTSVAICALDGTQELPPGEEGEICVSGPAVMLGYLDDPEATAAVPREHGTAAPGWTRATSAAWTRTGSSSSPRASSA